MKIVGLNIEPILKVENLSASYYKKDIVIGASLTIMPGEIVAVIGPNGSGKSTLLKAIYGVIRPNSGKIIFNSIDITGKDSFSLTRLGIGFLMQGGHIFLSLTVEEHLQLGCSTINGKNAVERYERVWKTFPNLYQYRKKRAGLLSGGERQMLAISMLLVQDAKLWLLDEPSGGLAPQAARNMFETLRKINNEHEVTILLVEQNLSGAINIADRAYILKEGKTFEEKNPIEILNNGKFEEIFF